MKSDLRQLKIKVELTVIEIILHAILWLIIGIITLGVGLMIYPYSVFKLVFNKAYLVDSVSSENIGKLKCELDIYSQIGHAVLWYIIGIITIGWGFLIYFYHVIKLALDRITIEDLQTYPKIKE